MKEKQNIYGRKAVLVFNPDQNETLIPENEAKPCCEECSLVFRTFAGFEYHIMKVHVNHCPYRCLYCGMMFYTESEGRYHIKHQHEFSSSHQVELGKHANLVKEDEMLYYYKKMRFLKNGNEEDEKDQLKEQIPSAIHNYPSANVLKFDRVKFELPSVLKRNHSKSSENFPSIDSFDSLDFLQNF